MNLKIKLFAVISAGIFFLIVAAPFVFRTNDTEALKSEVVEHALQMHRSVRAYVEAQNELLADRLANQIEIAHSKSGLLSDEFVGVSLIEDSQVSWYQAQDASLSEDWFRTEVTASLPSLKTTDSKDEVTWVRMVSPSQQVYFAMFTRLMVKSASGEKLFLAAGLLPSSVFSPASLIAKGTSTQLFLVDALGFAFSYPDQKYVGSKTTSNPFVAAAINQKPIPSYKNQDGSMRVGGVEKISNTNLMVVVDAPADISNLSMTEMIIQYALIGLVIVLVMGLIVGFMTADEIKQKQILADNLRMLSEKGTVDTVVIDESELRLKEFARGVVKCLQRPLTAIAGLIHLAEVKSTDKAVKEILDKITIEARRSRDFIESMNKALPATDMSQNVIDIVPVLDQVSAAATYECRKAKVQFETEIIGEYHVRCNGNEIKDALKTIMIFVLQIISTEGNESFEKTMRLRTRRIGGQVEITFDAFGVKLKKEIRRRAFQPFQGGLVKSRLLGLDMAIANTVVDDHNGSVDIESTDEIGFQVHVRLPLSISLDNTVSIVSDSGLSMLQPDTERPQIQMQPTESQKSVANANLSDDTVEAQVVVHGDVDEFTQEIESHAKVEYNDDQTLVLPQTRAVDVTSTKRGEENFFVKIRKPKVRLDI